MLFRSGRVAGDSDVVVVNNEFNVQVLGDGEAGSLSIITFLLRTVRSEHEDRLALVSHSDAVDPWPNMTETTGREFDTRGEAKFRVPWKFGVCFAVVEKVLGRDVTLNCGHQILGGNPMTCSQMK